jgi:hypothetical protein
MKLVIDGTGVGLDRIEADKVSLLYIALEGHGKFPEDSLLGLLDFGKGPELTIWADPDQEEPTHVIKLGKQEDTT